MGGLIALAVLFVLGVPAVALVALVLGLDAHRRLEAIERRLAAFEALSRSDGTTAPSVTASPIAPVNVLPSPPPAPVMSADAAQGMPPPEDVPPPPPPPEEELPRHPLPPTSVPPVLPPPPAAPGLEELFGTRWVVWVGGLALALGGIFLVRYSIERGWIGPGVRVMLGALLGAALAGAGEWLRRREKLAGVAGLPSAHIPGILTAAGTTVCYATVFAAYALYGFIGPTAGFFLLGIVALATLAAAVLHGPALAALGVAGADVTPLLVATETPNYWALYVYLALVTAAAFVLTRLRQWNWLAATAIAFSLFWAVPGLSVAGAPHTFHEVTGFALAALFLVAGFLLGPPAGPGGIGSLSSGALTAYLALAALYVIATEHDAAAFLPFAFMVAATVAIAWGAESAAGALLAAALLSTVVFAGWAVQPDFASFTVSGYRYVLPPEPTWADIELHLAVGALFASLFGGAGYLAQGRLHLRAGEGRAGVIPLVWAAAAVLTPLAILIALYYRIQGLTPSLLFASIAVALAAWFAVAADQLEVGEPRPGVADAAALHAAGSAAALALALTFALEKGWLTVGLAVMAPAIAYVADKRPLPLLRWLAAAAAPLVVARIGWEPRIVGDDLGTTPFFNWLLYGYGVPALAFWTAGFLLRRRADDVPSRMLDSAAILFTVLFAALEIRQAMTGGDIYAAHSGLDETSMIVCVALAMAIGLEWLRQSTGNVVHNVGSIAVAVLALVAVAFELVGGDNPRISGAPVGGVFFNLILIGYGLPAVLATILALIARRSREMPYRTAAAMVAVVLALAYLTLEIMRLYHGPQLTGAISDAEGYTFSAVWLAFGVALLVIALPLDSKPTRLASAAVVSLTTAKVFLVDLANLGGIWRALSFIGLGLVLVGIGYLYQRLLFPPRKIAP